MLVVFTTGGTVTFLSTASPCNSVKLNTKGGGGPSVNSPFVGVLSTVDAVTFLSTAGLVVGLEVDPSGVTGRTETLPLGSSSP